MSVSAPLCPALLRMRVDQKCNPDVTTGKFICAVWNWDQKTHVVQNATVCGNCSRAWDAFGWVRSDHLNPIVLPPSPLALHRNLVRESSQATRCFE